MDQPLSFIGNSQPLGFFALVIGPNVVFVLLGEDSPLRLNFVQRAREVGPLLASLILGIADVGGKYLVPELGAFIIYSVMIIVLVFRPRGLFVRG